MEPPAPPCALALRELRVTYSRAVSLCITKVFRTGRALEEQYLSHPRKTRCKMQPCCQGSGTVTPAVTLPCCSCFSGVSCTAPLAMPERCSEEEFVVLSTLQRSSCRRNTPCWNSLAMEFASFFVLLCAELLKPLQLQTGCISESHSEMQEGQHFRKPVWQLLFKCFLARFCYPKECSFSFLLKEKEICLLVKSFLEMEVVRGDVSEESVTGLQGRCPSTSQGAQVPSGTWFGEYSHRKATLVL